jgi:hypothetical protein
MMILWLIGPGRWRPGQAGTRHLVRKQDPKGIAHSRLPHGERRGIGNGHRTFFRGDRAGRPVEVRWFIEIAGEKDRLAVGQRGLEFLEQPRHLAAPGLARLDHRLVRGFDQAPAFVGNA